MTPDDSVPPTDELALLRRDARALGMPGDVTPTSLGIEPRSAAEMLAHVKAKAAAPESHVELATVSRLTPRHRKIVTRFVAAAAAATGVVGLILAPWQQESAVAISPPVLDYEFANARNIAYAPGKDARATLLALAATADAQRAAVGSGPTQYLLTDNWFANLGTTSASKLIPKQRETWFRSDGSIRVREVSGAPLTPDGRGVAALSGTKASKVVNETYPAEGLEPEFVTDLGDGVRRVRSALLRASQCEDRDAGPVRAACLSQEISSLYSQFVIPPQVAAEFWRILADEPTLRSLGTVEDRAGREGIGISFVPADAPQFRKVLIISPVSGKLLGTEDILIKNDPDVDVKAPAIYAFTANLESRFTRETGPRD